jgi:alpha(1,3/1,4) fucosyltransferase
MSRHQVRIALAKFWYPKLTFEGLFAGLPYLFDHFEFVPSDRPDFVVFSDSPGDLPPGDAVRIFYTGENVRPDFTQCDWAFTFDYDEELRHPRHLRLPNYVRIGAGRDLVKDPGRAEEILAGKSRFCNFIFHNDAEPRNGFFDRLSQYKPVDAPGRCRNNCAPVGPFASPTESRYASGYPGHKMRFMAPYKFSIAFENASYPGYTTEKLYHAMLAGTLPIYWGNPLVHRDFNPGSFLNAADYPSLEALAERVMEIDQDDELYLSYRREPWYPDNRPTPYVDPGRILARFTEIFASLRT